MSNEAGAGAPMFTNSLAARLFTDTKSNKNVNSTRGRPLTMSRSTPMIRKTNDLVAEFVSKKNDITPLRGDIKTLLLSTSPMKKEQGGHLSKTITALKYEEPPMIVVDKSPASFIDSLNLTAKEKFDLFHVPHYFLYLQKKPDDKKASRSVYELQAASQEVVDARQKSDPLKYVYFTISKEGVTQFGKEVSYFTPLDRWEREYKIFNKISNINFFKKYRRWKVMFDFVDDSYISILYLLGYF
jgi:hypothetical protein